MASGTAKRVPPARKQREAVAPETGFEPNVTKALAAAVAANTKPLATVVLVLDKETRNTFRYEEVAEDGEPVVRTIYLPKKLVGTPPPKTISVIISVSAAS